MLGVDLSGWNNNSAGAWIKSLVGAAERSNVSCVLQVDIARLDAVGAAGLFVEGWPIMRKARITRNRSFLVPEDGIEPAWAFWARVISN
jgi:hypothetical protein